MARKIQCEVCGSTGLIKEDNLFVCQACGIGYTVEEIRKQISGASAKTEEEVLDNNTAATEAPAESPASAAVEVAEEVATEPAEAIAEAAEATGETASAEIEEFVEEANAAEEIPAPEETAAPEITPEPVEIAEDIAAAPAAEEVIEAATETVEEAIEAVPEAAEEVIEAVPAAEDVIEEAPVAEEVSEAAPAAEEAAETAPVVEETAEAVQEAEEAVAEAAEEAAEAPADAESFFDNILASQVSSEAEAVVNGKAEEEAAQEEEEEEEIEDIPDAAPMSDFEIALGRFEKYKGNQTKVILPPGIKSLGSRCFEDTVVETVIMNNSIKIIEKDAFAGANCLRLVKLPEKMEKFDIEWFGDMTEGVKVELPTHLKEMHGCMTNNGIVNVPEGVEIIGGFSRYNDPKAYNYIKEIHLPTTLKKIKNDTFFNLESLTTVYWPASIELSKATGTSNSAFNGTYLFKGCSGLTSIITEISNQEFIDRYSTVLGLEKDLTYDTYVRDYYIGGKAPKEGYCPWISNSLVQFTHKINTAKQSNTCLFCGNKFGMFEKNSAEVVCKKCGHQKGYEYRK